MKVRLINAVVAAVLLASLLTTGQAADLENWQRSIALDPPDYILGVEGQKHRVWILRGLRDADVEQVMDDQFDRIEHLMFIQTQHVEPSGEAWVADEGCN